MKTTVGGLFTGVAAAALALLTSVLLIPAPVAAASTVECRAYPSIPVALEAGAPKSFQVWGELCARAADLVDGQTVQLLLHGAYYSHSYWNPDYDNGSYSYARSMAAKGIPTFAIDRIGQGQSSRPPSVDLSVQDDALVVHQIVRALKSGSIGETAFGPVIGVGHSVGSIVAWQEAVTYRDLAGVIITGMLHVVPLHTGVLTAGTNFRPAFLDPQFRDANLDAGYLTTAGGSRAQLFYNPGDAGSGIVAWDEAHKDATPMAEFAGAFTYATTDLTRAIEVPVLIIQGQNDFLLCGTGAADCSSAAAVHALEAAYYSPQAGLQAVVVPGSGHNVALSENRGMAEEASASWSRASVR
ncbi:alpha/beta hydrolase [Nocardia huaxiensis]|uniref:Alpha/beta hydrolase n=1 Tax=Nocardia huaxiensis TaxID=2755382 RepID=A0A7D6ZJ39_9NOCA|nr:alpha/beta hydrolase [Nocardia huaxiensis]QLY28963.1 alpha/beta hydrolase [Nocardia huaxiensis]